MGETAIVPHNEPGRTSTSSTPHSRWIAEQLTILAEAFSESMTPSRLRIYVGDLSDVPYEGLLIAFRRARCELKFFPRIAELRALAGMAAADQRSVEAEAAWKWASDYLRVWGVERLPIRKHAAWIEAPPIPPRIDYALRRIGGFAGLNQITEQSRPFMFRAFCESYALAPIATSLESRLLGPDRLQGEVRQLPRPLPSELDHQVSKQQVSTTNHKSATLTPEQVRERRAVRQQQAEVLTQRDAPNPPMEKPKGEK